MSEKSTRLSLAELHRLCWVALMAALIAAGAFVHVSIGPVPITFQEFFVVLAGLALGPRYGVYAVALYIFAGAVGLPVYSGGRAGIGQLAGPTGGYFLGFVLLAFLAGLGKRMAQRRALPDHLSSPLLPVIVCVLAGMGTLYFCGAAWLMHVMNFSVAEAFAAGVAPFLIPGPLKALGAVFIWRMLHTRGYLPADTARQTDGQASEASAGQDDAETTRNDRQ